METNNIITCLAFSTLCLAKVSMWRYKTMFRTFTIQKVPSAFEA